MAALVVASENGGNDEKKKIVFPIAQNFLRSAEGTPATSTMQTNVTITPLLKAKFVKSSP